MTVTATDAFTPAIGNGFTTVFPFTFFAPDPSQVQVLLAGAVQTSGFTVVTNPGAEGSVTFTTAPANGVAVLIALAPDFEQNTNFENAGPYLPSAVDTALDQAAARDIALNEALGRSIKAPAGEAALGPLPPKADRAGRYIALDANGDPVAASGTGADAGLRTDLAASSGTSLLAYLPVVGVSAVNLETALRLSLPLMPDHFGAVGNGVTNDTAAFAALGAHVQTANGGEIAFRRGATYVVGQQSLVNDGTRMFSGVDLLYLHDLTGPIIIRGNGAKVKYATGLKFGTFDAAGNPTTHALPYWGGERSDLTPSEGIISIQRCSGPIHIENIEGDGNAAGLTLGGPFGDTGYQCSADFLFLTQNTGPLTKINVHGHHFGRDGLDADCSDPANLTGDDIPRVQFMSINCTYEFNCRNNISWRGGRGAIWQNLKSLYAGDASLPFSSSPKSCFDVETEVGSCREMSFYGCAFGNGASGTAFLANGDVSDTEGLFFKECLFDNPASWALWSTKIPGLVLEDCRIFGAVNYGDPADLTRAGRFIRCRFTDKDGGSISGLNYTFTEPLLISGGGTTGTDAYLEDCTFDAHHVGPVSANGLIYQDCRFTIADGITAGLHANCTFRGHTLFKSTFAVSSVTDSPGIKVAGTIDQDNGTTVVRLFGGSATYDPASLATGAGATTTVTATGAKLGQRAEATFSLDLQGIRLFAWVSAANTVSVRFENNTGGTIDLASGTILVRVTDADVAA